jgi:hypothetical protein
MAAQCLHQRAAILIGADGDAQELLDALALKWRTMMPSLRKAAASSAASRCGWRAKTKLAAEGRTSKPSASSCATSAVRLAMTMSQVLRK